MRYWRRKLGLYRTTITDNPRNREQRTADVRPAWSHLIRADNHLDRTGRWPTASILESSGETGGRVDSALREGSRGLPAGGSLARLLAARRVRRNPAAETRLTAGQLLAWAGDHHRRTGRWPRARDGPIADAPGETWRAVAQAFQNGGRGLRAGRRWPGWCGSAGRGSEAVGRPVHRPGVHRPLARRRPDGSGQGVTPHSGRIDPTWTNTLSWTNQRPSDGSACGAFSSGGFGRILPSSRPWTNSPGPSPVPIAARPRTGADHS
jgi:hypothetical protein